MLTVLWLIAVAAILLALAYVGARGLVWTGALALALLAAVALHALPLGLALVVAVVLVVVATPLNVPRLRRHLLSEGLLVRFRRVLPPMSQTEREAIEAGTVWWDRDLFSGRPRWSRLLAVSKPQLSAEEQRFLDDEVEALCALVSDWETTHVHRDLPAHVWQFIKDKGFLGMIIPKEYGGLGFSAYAHSQVVTKLSTRCATVAVTVLVPNSLGPGELLLHYGTPAQKKHYLPRLARGLEIPCFALTNPTAGSDAAAIPDSGIVCVREFEGRPTLGLALTWEKRYITLGPVATLLGLAFRAYDPARLLGDTHDLGITCALIPTSHPGVEIGRRHMPLNAVFQNGPNSGRDVFIPLDWVIGGRDMLGKGWRMLVECLAAGRGISLPSSNTGMAKLAVRATGGYARVRTQFKTPIGRFEGIEEALTRMGANLYVMDATRMLTARAVDLGEKPAVLSSIAKYHITERSREVVNDAMDIVGGKGICMGPSNFLGAAYMQMPVSITVEGANILTRSLIIFGQGAIRCHPHVLREMAAAHRSDHAGAVEAFDEALFDHVRFVFSNLARALVLGLTHSRFVRVGASVAPEMRQYYRELTRISSALAFASDVSMAVMGGSLKRREKLSARLGDILSMLYLGSATLKRFEDDGRPAADAPIVHWAMQDVLFKAQSAFEGVISNFPRRAIGALLGAVIFPLGRSHGVPSDHLGRRVASLVLEPSATRDRLTAGMYLPRDEADPIGAIELALEAVIAAEPLEARIRAATKDGRLDRLVEAERLEAAHAAGVIDAAELAVMLRARLLVGIVIRVDDFAQDLGASERRAAVASEPVAGEAAPASVTRSIGARKAAA